MPLEQYGHQRERQWFAYGSTVVAGLARRRLTAPVAHINVGKRPFAITDLFTPELALAKNIDAPRPDQCTNRLLVSAIDSRQARHGYNCQKGILLNIRLFLVAAHVLLDQNLQGAAVLSL
ncbi:hypothetical protein [Pseudomonas abyssi]|uniref:hypothetical protein n=1 Tax=Pseudomonas abyssi TaxID=170540 RepID=UPI001054C451|nr:hypothetical protein [Pseudomonas abyssi]